MGNLLDMFEAGDFDVIVHGCNCFHIMGAGIAAQIKERFPTAYQAGLKTPKYYTEFGRYSKAKFPNCGITLNTYTQYGLGGPRTLNYNDLYNVFCKIKKDFSGRYIAYPKIGIGLAGGDWRIIDYIIRTVFGEREAYFRKLQRIRKE